MSLYREPGRIAGRTLWIAAGVALLVGLVGGYAIGRATAPDPSLADKVGDLRDQVQPARQGLELIPTEYPQAVRGGRVAAPTEYQAVQQDVKRVKDTIAGASDDLQALAPARASAVQRAVDALAAAVNQRADPRQVARLSAAAAAALTAAVGR